MVRHGLKNINFHLKCVRSMLNSNGRRNDFPIVELCVFMLISLLRREGVVSDKEGSSMLPYSCSRPRTTDSLSSSESQSESTIDRISSTSSILFNERFSSLSDLTLDLPISPMEDFFGSMRELPVLIRDFPVSILDRKGSFFLLLDLGLSMRDWKVSPKAKYQLWWVGSGSGGKRRDSSGRGWFFGGCFLRSTGMFLGESMLSSVSQKSTYSSVTPSLPSLRLLYCSLETADTGAMLILSYSFRSLRVGCFLCSSRYWCVNSRGLAMGEYLYWLFGGGLWLKLMRIGREGCSGWEMRTRGGDTGVGGAQKAGDGICCHPATATRLLFAVIPSGGRLSDLASFSSLGQWTDLLSSTTLTLPSSAALGMGIFFWEQYSCMGSIVLVVCGDQYSGLSAFLSDRLPLLLMEVICSSPFTGFGEGCFALSSRLLCWERKYCCGREEYPRQLQSRSPERSTP